MGFPMTAPARPKTTGSDNWADLNGRWFFAWRMAAACQDALREIRQVKDHQRDQARHQALEKADELLRRELIRWVRRGEALDIIVQHTRPVTD